MIESKEPKPTPQEDIDLLADKLQKQQMENVRRTLLKATIEKDFASLLDGLRALKSDTRSPFARECAIVITLLETAYARFCTFVK